MADVNGADAASLICAVWQALRRLRCCLVQAAGAADGCECSILNSVSGATSWQLWVASSCQLLLNSDVVSQYAFTWMCAAKFHQQHYAAKHII